jgi:hypothetical protein
MRRFAMVGAVLTMGTVLGVLTPVAGSTAAWADGPQHVKSTITFDVAFPAGEVCDFALDDPGTLYVNSVIFPDKTIDHIEDQVAHTNQDTGFTLTETVHYVETFTAADGQFKDVGLFWHLRTPGGKLVVVQAGQLVISTTTGEVVKVTPAVNPDFAAVICPALGGSPAS